MAASAEARYQWGESQILEVEVTSDSDSPDVMDDLVRRTAHLLDECVAAIDAKVRD